MTDASAAPRRRREGPPLLLLLLPLATLAVAARPAAAGDWPQILGPDRNGEADGETLRPWPAAGPRLLWKRPLGGGFAGAAVAGERVLAFHRDGDKEVLLAVDADDGGTLWQAAFDARYRGGVNPDRGPRCVPLVDGDRVLAFGAGGDLHCVSLEDGRPLWSRALYQDYRALEGYFGAGSTPLVVGDAVLVNVGGRADAGLVAVSRRTGKTLWKRGDDNASYSSPTAYRHEGRPRAVFVTRLHCVSVDPATGKEWFRFRFGQTGPTVNAATPLVFDNTLFITASYGVGAKCLSLDDPPRVKWENDESMSSQYTTCVQRDGMLYGVHGREDVGEAELRCVEAATGRIRWKHPQIGVAHLILAGEHLLVQEVSGRLSLVAADPRQCRVLATHALGPGDWRALPALSGGRACVRRTDGNGGELQCLQVGR